MDVQMLLNVAASTTKLMGLSIDIIRDLSRLCDRYRDAQLILESISGQVNVLKVALKRINELAMGGTSTRHHQLTLDLGNSLQCCDLLLTRLGADVANLSTEKDGVRQSEFAARLKIAFNGGPASDIQAMLDRQANALTLLLTIYNCQSTLEQGSMLQDPQKRELLNQVEEDGLSLKVHRDSESFVTQTTDRLSLLSRTFTFDEILLSTKLYSDKSRLLIQLLRKRVQQAKAPLSEDELRVRAERTTSKEIDRQIRRGQDRVRPNHIFLTFTYPDTHNDLIRQLNNIGVVYQTNAPDREQVEQQDNRVKRFGLLYPMGQPHLWIWEPGNCLRGVKDLTIHTAGGLSGREKWLTAAVDLSMIILVTDMTNSLGNSKPPDQFLSDAERFFNSITSHSGCWSIRCWIVLCNEEKDERVHQLYQLTKASPNDSIYQHVKLHCYTKTEFYNSPAKVLRSIIVYWISQAALRSAGLTGYKN